MRCFNESSIKLTSRDLRPRLGRVRFERKGVDRSADCVAQGAVDELVLLDQRLTLEGSRYYPRLIMIFGARQIDELDFCVGQGRQQQTSNAFRSHPSLARGF